MNAVSTWLASTAGIYGGVAIIGGVLLSLQIWYLGGSMVEMVPAIYVIVAVLGRLKWLLTMVPVAIFGSLLVAFLWDGFRVTELESLILALTSCVVIGASFRLSEIVGARHPTRMGRKLFRASVPKFDRIAPSHLVSLLLFGLAWWSAGYLITDFTNAANSPRYLAEYQLWLKRTYRLVAWAYCGIQIVVVLAAVFTITNGLLSYWGVSSRAGLMPHVRLLHELWKWNGPDQRRIGRAVAKQGRES